VKHAKIVALLQKHAGRALDDAEDRAALADAFAVELEVENAQHQVVCDYLARLVRHVERAGGFMWSEDQALLRGARALLAERGGK
jgi:hypothetical protein